MLKRDTNPMVRNRIVIKIWNVLTAVLAVQTCVFLHPAWFLQEAHVSRLYGESVIHAINISIAALNAEGEASHIMNP